MKDSIELKLPAEFVKRLRLIIPEGRYDQVIHSFSAGKTTTFRINPAHPKEAVLKRVLQSGLQVEPVPWLNSAYVIMNNESMDIIRTLEEEGAVYRQGLSSLLVPVVLDPRPGEKILDTCAAPGSKTSQMAQMMGNTGEIVAVEGVKQRLYKLKTVLNLQGISNTKTVLMDARKYKSPGLEFDKILVDAPCSSEGRFDVTNKKSFAYWSPRKIREMRKKQKGILLNSARLLKPGGVLVYSTCTFAPEENEQVVDWFLRKAKGKFIIDTIPLAQFPGIESYPAVERWGEMEFSAEVSNCLRVFPDNRMDGFFITKFRRVD